MKRLHEFSNEELAGLSDEQISELIDLECMCNGAPLEIEKPKYRSLPDVPNPDITVYEVCGYILTDESEADSFIEFINKLTSVVRLDYDYRQGSEYKYIDKKERETTSKRIRQVYSKDEYTAIESILTERKNIKAYNDELRNEYEERYESRREIIADINEAIELAVAEVEKEKDAMELFERYLKLCNGDYEVAQNFFKESRYSSLLEKVLEKIKYREEQENE